jgi:outer membrane protein assembly factor BamB
MLHEGLLLVQWDQHVDSQLMALDSSTGEVEWRVPRGVISWSSPIRVHTGERWELVLTNSTSVDAFDPATGVKLWGHDCLDGEMGPSAAYADGWFFAVNDYATAVGIRTVGDGTEVAWTNDEYLPDTASPVATNGLVFLTTSYGTVACLDATTGKVLWTQDFPMGFYASPIVVGDLVYCLDLDGVMHIVRASETFELVAESALGEPAAATPAVVGGRIYLRGEASLYCITGDLEES